MFYIRSETVYFSDNSELHKSPTKAASSSQAFGLIINKTFAKSKKINQLPHSTDVCANRCRNCTSRCFCRPATADHVTSSPTALRSLSFDYDYLDENEPVNRTISARRYSYQGFQEKPPKVFRVKSPYKFFSTPQTTRDTTRAVSTTPLASTHRYEEPARSAVSSQQVPDANILFAYDSWRSPAALSDTPNQEGSLTSDDLRGRVISFKSANGNVTKKIVFPSCTCLPGKLGKSSQCA